MFEPTSTLLNFTNFCQKVFINGSEDDRPLLFIKKMWVAFREVSPKQILLVLREAGAQVT